MSEQLQMFDIPPIELPEPEKPTKVAKRDMPNPCIALHGPGPEGRQCKDCCHLVHFRQAASWYKCELRTGKQSRWGSVGTDHKVRWSACGKFEEAKNEDNNG